MKHANLTVAGLISLGLVCLLQTPLPAANVPYRLLKEIPIGGDGGWDYLSVDAAAHRLYVTHADRVVVVDLDQDARVGEITALPGIHGFALAPDLGRGFSSNGREARASIVDLKILKTVTKVRTGENPDAILYEPGRHEVYAFNGRSRSVTVFDALSGNVTNTIALPGKPEFAAVDPQLGRVYCNIEDQNAVIALDTQTHRLVNTWPTAPGTEPAGLALDPVHHRLFVGCHNQRLVMLDSTNGAFLAAATIGQGVDATAFDPGTQYVFSSCGDGTVTITQLVAPDNLASVQTLATARGARTMALDPRTHRIYLAAAQYEAAPAPTSAAAPQRPRIIPGSMKILVYGMEPAPEPAAAK